MQSFPSLDQLPPSWMSPWRNRFLCDAESIKARSEMAKNRVIFIFHYWNENDLTHLDSVLCMWMSRLFVVLLCLSSLLPLPSDRALYKLKLGNCLVGW